MEHLNIVTTIHCDTEANKLSNYSIYAKLVSLYITHFMRRHSLFYQLDDVMSMLCSQVLFF